MRTWPLNKKGREIIYFGKRIRLWLWARMGFMILSKTHKKEVDRYTRIYYECGVKK